MPQVINGLDVTNLQGVTATANVPNTGQPNGYINGIYAPSWRLKNAVASYDENGNEIFPAQAAQIPDNFATNEQPKLNFLFTVQFFPRNGLTLPETGDENMNAMKFALKRATRPQPQISYQDMNFYGLRQKVATKIDYGTVTLGFYDDVVNRAHNIFTQYFNLVSPISNIEAYNADDLSGSIGGAITYGAMNHQYGPFQYMRVTHHMINDKAANSCVPKQVYYDYLNPKIVQVTLDDLDMTTSNANTIEIQFVYDSVNIIYSDAQDQTNSSSIDANGNVITSNPNSNTSQLNSQNQSNYYQQAQQGFN